LKINSGFRPEEITRKYQFYDEFSGKRCFNPIKIRMTIRKKFIPETDQGIPEKESNMFPISQR
jgi:hypothetical protein